MSSGIVCIICVGIKRNIDRSMKCISWLLTLQLFFFALCVYYLSERFKTHLKIFGAKILDANKRVLADI